MNGLANWISALLVACSVTSTDAAAIPLTGLGAFDADDSLVTFDEFSFPNVTFITTQFAALGVTLSPDPIYRTDFPPISGFSGNSISEFRNSRTELNIIFSSTVNAAGAFFLFNPDSFHVFEALYQGNLVESFSFTEPSCCAAGATPEFIATLRGFEAIEFDTIRILHPGSTFVALDNLRFSPVSVSEPSSLAMLGAGLLGLGAAIRRRLYGRSTHNNLN